MDDTSQCLHSGKLPSEHDASTVVLNFIDLPSELNYRHISHKLGSPCSLTWGRLWGAHALSGAEAPLADGIMQFAIMQKTSQSQHGDAQKHLSAMLLMSLNKAEKE